MKIGLYYRIEEVDEREEFFCTILGCWHKRLWKEVEKKKGKVLDTALDLLKKDYDLLVIEGMLLATDKNIIKDYKEEEQEKADSPELIGRRLVLQGLALDKNMYLGMVDFIITPVPRPPSAITKLPPVVLAYLALTPFLGWIATPIVLAGFAISEFSPDYLTRNWKKLSRTEKKFVRKLRNTFFRWQTRRTFIWADKILSLCVPYLRDKGIKRPKILFICGTPHARILHDALTDEEYRTKVIEKIGKVDPYVFNKDITVLTSSDGMSEIYEGKKKLDTYRINVEKLISYAKNYINTSVPITQK